LYLKRPVVDSWTLAGRPLRVLFIEHLTVSPPADVAANSLADEGWAMLESAARDVSELPGMTVAAAVHQSRDGRRLGPAVEAIAVGDDAMKELAQVAAAFDGVIIVAPEIDGIASRWTKSLEAAGATLLSPPSQFVDWASDKLDVARTLAALSPATWMTREAFQLSSIIRTSAERFVVKPRDGVGAMFTLAVDWANLSSAIDWIRANGCRGELVIQPRIVGDAVSVAVVGREGRAPIVLPTAHQEIEETKIAELPTATRFHYRGGLVPLAGFDDRIRRLVDELWRKVDPFDGWFGLDLVLADDGDDVIVDVNPRLTTSYLGYSRLLPGIGGRLLVGGETESDLERIRGPFDMRIAFDAAGRVEVHSQRA
jgi:predicted ATP-grasp superfamily ATP-dependent carboligase